MGEINSDNCGLPEKGPMKSLDLGKSGGSKN